MICLYLKILVIPNITFPPIEALCLNDWFLSPLLLPNMLLPALLFMAPFPLIMLRLPRSWKDWFLIWLPLGFLTVEENGLW